jgi:signal transduction histidine kinase
VLAIAVVAALAVVLFAVPLAVVLQRVHRDEELLRLERDTVAATRAIDVGTTGDPIELPRTAAQLAVYDSAGRRIAGGGGPAIADAVVRQALRSQAPAHSAAAGLLVVAVPLIARERVVGAVRAQRDDAVATRSARDQWWLLVGVGAAVIALAIAAAVLLGRHLARPLERLAVAARRLGEGDFAVRAPRAGVAEVDDVADALDRAAARLDDLVSRERAFTADASHQLRTPLAALRLELEALELRGAAPPELARGLAQVERLQGTIDTLLAVARDAPPRAARTALGPLLDDAESRWRGPLAERGRPLRVRADESELAAGAAGSVVREILDVLLENALRHGAGEVDVHARRAGAMVALDVADEGTGDPLDPELVFERRSAGAAGHGIGLALARSLAHAEGGRLVLGRPAPPLFTLLMPPPQAVGRLAVTDRPV